EEPCPRPEVARVEIHTQAGIRVAISGGTELRAGSRRNDRTAVERRLWIADVGAVINEAVVVAVKAVLQGERRAGLKRGDAGNRPAPQRAFPESANRCADVPYIGDGEPAPAVIIARPVIELQTALHHRHGGQVSLIPLVVHGA